MGRFVCMFVYVAVVTESNSYTAERVKEDDCYELSL